MFSSHGQQWEASAITGTELGSQDCDCASIQVYSLENTVLKLVIITKSVVLKLPIGFFGLKGRRPGDIDSTLIS